MVERRRGGQTPEGLEHPRRAKRQSHEELLKKGEGRERKTGKPEQWVKSDRTEWLPNGLGKVSPACVGAEPTGGSSGDSWVRLPSV